MKALLLVASLLLLSSCLLKQNEPVPLAPQAGKVPLDGVVALEDVQGAVQGAYFFAAFSARAAAAGAASWVGLHRYAALESAIDERAPRCEIAKKKKTASPAAAKGFINVGKLLFGVALQTAAVEVLPNAENQYLYKLTPGFAAGVYQVTAKATAETQPFEGLITVPESVRELTGNGTRFNENVVRVKKSTGLVLQWAPPSVPNDSNLILMDLEAQTNDEIYRLRCLAREPQSTAAGSLTAWTVDPTLIRQLPSTQKARLDFLRAAVRPVKTTYLTGEFQGLRTNVAALLLEE